MSDLGDICEVNTKLVSYLFLSLRRQLSHGREMAMQLAVAAIKPQTRSLPHTLELR